MVWAKLLGDKIQPGVEANSVFNPSHFLDIAWLMSVTVPKAFLVWQNDWSNNWKASVIGLVPLNKHELLTEFSGWFSKEVILTLWLSRVSFKESIEFWKELTWVFNWHTKIPIRLVYS